MKTWEAIKALENGKKVRYESWEEGKYLYVSDNVIVWYNGLAIDPDTIMTLKDGWQIYIEYIEPPEKIELSWVEIKNAIYTSNAATDKSDFYYIKKELGFDND